MQALWDANGAAIYKANQAFKTAYGRNMSASVRRKAIKDATVNGHFSAGAYAGNIEQARRDEEAKRAAALRAQQEAMLAEKRRRHEAQLAREAELERKKRAKSLANWKRDDMRAADAVAAQSNKRPTVRARHASDDPPEKCKWWQVGCHLRKTFQNKSGSDLMPPLSDTEVLLSPSDAAMYTYTAAGINVQYQSSNSEEDLDAGNGPAQVSQNQLDAPYGEPYGCDEKGKNCRGYGLGLPGESPFDDEIAIEGMRRRIQQVVDEAERLGENRNISVNETDTFIIAAMVQNGGGFDLNDIQDVMRSEDYHTPDGKINWTRYFDDRQSGWDKRVDNTKWWQFVELFQQSRTGGADYNTKFMLEKFYTEAMDLQADGYYLPDDLDSKLIQDLFSKSEN